MFRQLVVLLVLAVHTGAALADVLPPPKKKGGDLFAADTTPWWSEEDAGWLGAIVGSAVGAVGAVFGVTAGLGKARSFVLALAAVLFGTGILLLAIGLGALASGQPWHVHFLFFVIGGVLTLVMGLNWPILKRRYDQLEFQRLRALDV